MAEFIKIGVWQTAFLGDALLTLPLLKALENRFPGAEIHYFVRAGLEGLFSALPGLASVRPFAKRGADKGLGRAWALGRSLSREGFDLWVSAHVSLRSAVVAKASSIPVRIGYDKPWFNRLAYTRTVSRQFDELEEVERLMELARPLGIEGPAPDPEMVLPRAAVDVADAYFSELTRPVLGVHPGSTWPTKQWPEERFAEVVARAAQAGATVLVFGGPGEEPLAARIVDQAKSFAHGADIRDLSGRLDLPGLAAHLARLDACLTNDSGPMHLAWVQRVPLVALFGPTVRGLGFFPRGEGSTVLELPGLDCRPCGLHGPRRCPLGHHRCMTDISPDRVWEALAPKLGL